MSNAHGQFLRWHGVLQGALLHVADAPPLLPACWWCVIIVVRHADNNTCVKQPVRRVLSEAANMPAGMLYLWQTVCTEHCAFPAQSLHIAAHDSSHGIHREEGEGKAGGGGGGGEHGARVQIVLSAW